MALSGTTLVFVVIYLSSVLVWVKEFQHNQNNVNMLNNQDNCSVTTALQPFIGEYFENDGLPKHCCKI